MPGTRAAHHLRPRKKQSFSRQPIPPDEKRNPGIGFSRQLVF
jgi:hypothetical protein